jgi:signal transduction histidine kinase
MVVVGLVGGYFVSRWMLHRLDVINRTTARIMAGDLSRRIEVSDTDDEFDELGRNVNSMLDRIDRLLASMRQVTDDIAHDLRTPLTRLRSRIEVGLMHELSSAESRDLLEATIRDADNLIETFNALLSIARAEAGGQSGDWERIDLSEVASVVCELYEPLAEDKGVTLTLVTADEVATLGNRQLVAQAIANLADNAVKYASQGGHVWLRTAALPSPRVEVADDGPGIPPDQRERAKQRFVRLDTTRTTPGSGLGLSLVDAVAKLHDAKLELLDNNPGLKVLLTFHPLPPPERPARGVPERAPTYAGVPPAGDRPAA